MGMALLLDTSSSSINIDPLSSFLAPRSRGKSLRVFYLLESGTVPQIEISVERIPWFWFSRIFSWHLKYIFGNAFWFPRLLKKLKGPSVFQLLSCSSYSAVLLMKREINILLHPLNDPIGLQVVIRLMGMVCHSSYFFR